MEKEKNRPHIETLACPYPDCHLYAQKGASNLTVRKVYGKDRIRYLRCRACAREFSERKGTALFGTKIAEEKAVSVVEHLAEGVSTKGTSRLVGVSAEAIRRLRRNVGDHARDFHDQRVLGVQSQGEVVRWRERGAASRPCLWCALDHGLNPAQDFPRCRKVGSLILWFVIDCF